MHIKIYSSHPKNKNKRQTDVELEVVKIINRNASRTYNGYEKH